MKAPQAPRNSTAEEMLMAVRVPVAPLEVTLEVLVLEQELMLAVV